MDQGLLIDMSRQALFITLLIVAPVLGAGLFNWFDCCYFTGNYSNTGTDFSFYP